MSFVDYSTDSAQAAFYRNIFREVKDRGVICSPRGQKVLEIENYHVDIPPFVRFPNFASRKLKVSYTKRELLWYLRADPYDLSIADHAKLWLEMVDANGRLNSNYGVYIFGRGGFDWVVQELTKDKDSRRAAIPILAQSHLHNKAKDVPCTYGLSFRIRNNKLNMSAGMRSNDSVYGFCSDAAIFSIIHEMMLRSLQVHYPELECGVYHHHADSFHVYEKHFGMLERLCDENEPFSKIDVPLIKNAEEVTFLRGYGLEPKLPGQLDVIPEDFAFTRWLNTF